ncbi:ATP-binding protein [Ectobacillus funiculus]|uniref:AAA family ATPase n=1 Tax=Ectobacillus funiculus TaxID=137993 RepID=UPI00397AC3E2
MLSLKNWSVYDSYEINTDNELRNIKLLINCLELEGYSIGENPSTYQFAGAKIMEYRSNLYLGKIAVLKLIIHINYGDYLKSNVIVQKIRKRENYSVKIQEISNELEIKWMGTFSKREYKINSQEINDLINKIQEITRKIKEYISNPDELPKIRNFASFLEELVEVKNVNLNQLVNGDNRLSYLKLNNIINFMKEDGIFKLESTNWYLTKKGEYYNALSPKNHQYGNVFESPSKLEYVFKNQDVNLNPFYSESMVYNESKLQINELENFNNFRLINFKLFNDEFLDTEFNFGSNIVSNTKKPFITIIIGPNGTGKSRALVSIERIFQDLYSLKTNKRRIEPINYAVEYKIGELLHKITVINDQIKILINDNVVSTKEIILPQKLLTSSFSVNDRFTFKTYNKVADYNEDDFYEYLGIRSTTNAVHLTAASKKLALNIIKSKDNKIFWEKLHKILNFLDFDSTLKLRFKIDDELHNINEINYQKIHTRINQINKKQKIKNEELILEEDRNIYIDFLKKVENRLTLGESFFKKENIEISYELNTEHKLQEDIKEELDIIYILLKLKVLNAQGIELKKRQFFKVEHASSGENHILYEMINILSHVKNNSLMLIDEPEINLHPNWQYKYIELLNTIFNDPTCHFIIATHSHFMMSDLREDSSSIITMAINNNGKLNSQLYDYNTFGWAAEDILYSVFGMKTVRNFFIEKDLRIVLGLIASQSTEYHQIKHILEKLKKLTLKKEDPLNLVIEQIEGYLRKNG